VSRVIYSQKFFGGAGDCDGSEGLVGIGVGADTIVVRDVIIELQGFVTQCSASVGVQGFLDASFTGISRALFNGPGVGGDLYVYSHWEGRVVLAIGDDLLWSTAGDGSGRWSMVVSGYRLIPFS
jgi:hypothetical protein